MNLETLIEEVRKALAQASRRRPVASDVAIAELTMLAARHVPMASLRDAGNDERAIVIALEHWEQAVYARYAFKSVRRFQPTPKRNATANAIHLIVMVVCELVAQKRLDIYALHEQCGWE